MSTNGHVGTVGQSDSNGALVLQPRDDSWGLCPDSPEEPRRPWHQLDVDMCLVPQWTMPSCPTADWSMMSSSTPVTLRMLSRVEAAAMPPSELRNHMALLQGQLELLLTVNTVRKADVFQSRQFGDEEILQQVASPKHQGPLSAHGHTATGNPLNQMGPCFVTLAQAGLECLNASNGKASAQAVRAALVTSLRCQPLADELCKALEAFSLRAVLHAMRLIAESSLDRDVPVVRTSPDEVEFSVENLDPQLRQLEGELGTYRPVNFLARNTSGTLYTAVLLAKTQNKWETAVELSLSPAKSKTLSSSLHVNPFGRLNDIKSVLRNITAQVVLKKVLPAQRDSALNELRIARRLNADGGQKYTVVYIDSMQDHAQDLWLVLRRVQPSRFGVSLTEYINSGFFQVAGHDAHASAMVLHLLQGLRHIGKKSVLMRNVKPDNILVEHVIGTGSKRERFIPRFSDFGLSVDVSGRGDNLRQPKVPQTAGNGNEELVGQLVGWWYDTQKNVPNPKWGGRAPPERQFHGLAEGVAGAFDVYMVGLVFCCMAFGVDFPHIDRPSVKLQVEQRLKMKMVDNYLSTFELGATLRTHPGPFVEAFRVTFGTEFGSALLRIVQNMLAKDPAERPFPQDALDELGRCDVQESEL